MIRKVPTSIKRSVKMNEGELSYGYAAYTPYETQPQKQAFPAQMQCQADTPRPIIDIVPFNHCQVSICLADVGTIVINKLINPAMVKQFGEFISATNLMAMCKAYPNISNQFNVGFDTGACTCVEQPGQLVIRGALGNYRVLSVLEMRYFFKNFRLEPYRWYTCDLKDLLKKPNQKFYAVAYPHYMIMPVQTQLQGCQLLNSQGIKHGYGDVAIFESDNLSQLPLITDNGSAFTLHFNTAGTSFDYIEKPRPVESQPSYAIFSL